MFMRYKVTVNTSHYPKEGPWELPEGWVKCKLSDVCQFESGFAFKSESYKKKGVPLIRISNIQEGTITTDGGVCIQEVVESRFHIVKGDLLIALSGATTGKMGIYDKDDDALLNQRVGNLRVISKTCFLPEYRNLFMESQAATILEQAWGGAQPNISPNTIIGFDILLPPYAEQCRIVSKANELLAIVSHIESAQDQIETTADGIKTKILDLAIRGKIVPQDDSEEPAINLLRRINPAFQPSDNLHYEGDFPNGWVSASLGEVSNYGHCISVPVEKIGNDDWVLELEDIEKDTGRILQRLSKKDRKISGIRHQFKKGQILYSKLRTYLNKVLIADEDGFCTTEIIPITPINGVNALFLIIVLRSQYFLDYTQNCCYGVKMPRLGTNDAKKAVIPLPPFEEQGRIVAAVKGLFLTITQIGHVIENQE